MDRSEIENLISRTALGDRGAFARLFDATSGKLLAVCLRVLKDRSQAEAAMQDAYVKIWTHAARFQVTGHSPTTWLITIARKTAIDRLRAQRPTTDFATCEDTPASAGPTPQRSAVAVTDAKKLSACLDELPQERRGAIIGAYLDGQSYADLASRYDVPLDTMRTWLRRGLVGLREYMPR